MAKCKTCGAPVNLAPDGDPKYEPTRGYRAEVKRLRNALETLNGPDWEAMFTADQDWA